MRISTSRAEWDGYQPYIATLSASPGARFTIVRTSDFCSTNSFEPVLKYGSNEFVALTNLCETGPRAICLLA